MAGKKYKGPLPKPKPTKVERLLNKRVKGEKGPYIPKIGDLNEMGPMIIDTKTGKQVKRLNKGGSTFPDLTGDGKVTQKDILKGRGVTGFEEGGSTISNADLEKLRKNLPFVPGKSGISDADLKKFRKNLPVRGKSGKDISNADLEKLMKPTNFEEGGEVRGMGRAYMGPSRKAKIR